jgi:hypothetical protein
VRCAWIAEKYLPRRVRQLATRARATSSPLG